MKYVLTIIFTLLSILAPSSTVAPINSIPKLFEQRDYLLEAIIFVESRGIDTAYNDREDAVGIVQLRPIMVREANRIKGYKKYKMSDRWDPELSKEIWYCVQRHHNPTYNLVLACQMWNGGNIKTKVPVYTAKVLARYELIKKHM